MLSGKSRDIFNVLKSSKGEWVSSENLILSVWGNDSLSDEDSEKKWRRNLNGQLSLLKRKLESGLNLEKSQYLDAVRLIDNRLNFKKSEVFCTACSVPINTFELETGDREVFYCVKCLCSMMEDLGV
jgi:hypothetical protein